MPADSSLSKLLDQVEKFVVTRKGHWDHAAWEQLLEDARSLGYPFDEDECKRNLGNILEGAKYFHNHPPASSEAAKKAPARKAPAKKAAARKQAL